MRLARVVGNVISTVKDPCYTGYKLMLVEYLDPDTRQPDGARQIVFDCVDAGVGDIVLVNIDGGATPVTVSRHSRRFRTKPGSGPRRGDIAYRGCPRRPRGKRIFAEVHYIWNSTETYNQFRKSET